MARALAIPLLITAALLLGCDESAPELADHDATDVLDVADADAVDERCKGVNTRFSFEPCQWEEDFSCDLGLEVCEYDYPIGSDGLAWAWCSCASSRSSDKWNWICQTTECKPPEYYDME